MAGFEGAGKGASAGLYMRDRTTVIRMRSTPVSNGAHSYAVKGSLQARSRKWENDVPLGKFYGVREASFIP
jgi:hypothetical protein